jgi:voltage-gated sodium channel
MIRKRHAARDSRAETALIEPESPGSQAAAIIMQAYIRTILSTLEKHNVAPTQTVAEAMRFASRPKGVRAKRKSFAYVADSAVFGYVMVATVLLSTIQIGVETDANRPELILLAKVLDNVCCLVFLVEVVIRVGAYGFPAYWALKWNRFDFFLCCVNVLETWIMANNAMFAKYFRGTMALRSLRIFRVARVLRLFKYFKELWMVLEGLIGSMRMVSWVALLLCVVLSVCSILCRQTIANRGMVDLSDDFNQGQLFGSMIRSMITLFNIVLLTEDWDNVARPLFEVDPLFFAPMLVFLFITTFSVFNVIIGVVVDDVLMNQKEDAHMSADQLALKHAEFVWDMYCEFFDLDVNGDGVVDLDEFISSPSIGDAIEMIAAQQHGGKFNDVPQALKVSGKELFDCMDINRDGVLNRKEFTRGMIRTLEACRYRNQCVNALIGQARQLLSQVRALNAERSLAFARGGGGARSTAPGTTKASTFDDGESSHTTFMPSFAPDDEGSRLAWLRSQTCAPVAAVRFDFFVQVPSPGSARVYLGEITENGFSMLFDRTGLADKIFRAILRDCLQDLELL